MKYFKLLVLFCLIFGAMRASGQVDYQQQYLNAKGLFGDEQYSLAMEAFKPLTQASSDNPYAAYASFYYAVAAYKDGYEPLAKDMFLQIRQRFPKWSRLNEVNYWLGKIYFENKEYNQALNILKEIRQESFEEDVHNLKYQFLFQIDDLQALKALYENWPNEKVLGEILAFKIASQPMFEQDQQLLDELIRKFGLNEAGLELVMIEETVFKDSYRVGVLFPLLVDELEPDERKVNQLILDAYLGIKLAVDTLRKAGINIELFAYDTKRDSATTADILAKDELKSMDLIIAPLFPEPRALVQEFSFKNKINLINLLSLDADLVSMNPYAFLLHPTNETIGTTTAAYVADSVQRKPGIIFYGHTKGDSARAFAYKERIEKEGFNIVLNYKIERDSSRHVLDILLISDEEIKAASAEDAWEKYAIAPDSIGHIFIASDDDLISSKVISAVETRGDSITVVGSADMLNLEVINYNVYDRVGAILYAPMYMKKDAEAFRNFRTDYVRIHKVPPSSFAALGYEMMLFMGNSLHKYGKYFQLGWKKRSFMEGYLTPGYSYEHSQANEVVPIIQFGEQGMEITYKMQEEDPDEEVTIDIKKIDEDRKE